MQTKMVPDCLIKGIKFLLGECRVLAMNCPPALHRRTSTPGSPKLTFHACGPFVSSGSIPDIRCATLLRSLLRKSGNRVSVVYFSFSDMLSGQVVKTLSRRVPARLHDPHPELGEHLGPRGRYPAGRAWARVSPARRAPPTQRQLARSSMERITFP